MNREKSRKKISTKKFKLFFLFFIALIITGAGFFIASKKRNSSLNKQSSTVTTKDSKNIDISFAKQCENLDTQKAKEVLGLESFEIAKSSAVASENVSSFSESCNFNYMGKNNTKGSITVIFYKYKEGNTAKDTEKKQAELYIKNAKDTEEISNFGDFAYYSKSGNNNKVLVFKDDRKISVSSTSLTDGVINKDQLIEFTKKQLKIK